MTISELNRKLSEIEAEYEKSKRIEFVKFCDANNPYKIGDTFTDHIGSIKVELIKYTFGNKPCCVYFGTELKKDGTPRKDGNKRQAWQTNDIKQIHFLTSKAK